MNNDFVSRRGSFTNVSSFSAAILQPLLKKNGISDVKIISSWEDIVGSKLASKTLPLKITNLRQNNTNIKTLHLLVNDSSTALIVNYQKQIILEKIAFYTGNKSIGNIRIIQGNYRPDHEDEEEARPLATKLYEEQNIADVDDEDVRLALKSLGDLVVNK